MYPTRGEHWQDWHLCVFDKNLKSCVWIELVNEINWYKNMTYLIEACDYNFNDYFIYNDFDCKYRLGDDFIDE